MSGGARRREVSGSQAPLLSETPAAARDAVEIIRLYLANGRELIATELSGGQVTGSRHPGAPGRPRRPRTPL
ncbi:MAG: hypothetical protein AAF531_03415 [Actinomycetota bacterium]